MKKIIMFALTFAAFIVAALPISTVGMFLTPLDSYHDETLDMSGLGLPGSNLDIGVDAAILALADVIGVAPSDLLGPGGGVTGVEFTGTYIQSLASSAGMTEVELWDVGDFDEIQAFSQTLMWARIYQLGGDPGSMANISLSYTLEDFHVNVAADARSESSSGFLLGYGISIPGQYSMNAQEVFEHEIYSYFEYIGTSIICALFPQVPCVDNRWFTDTIGGGHDWNYHFATLTWGDGTDSDVFDLGTMQAGDLLYVWGFHEAGTECGTYGPGLCFAGISSNLEIQLGIEEITPPLPPESIPEPTTMLLLGSGLFGLGAFRKRSKVSKR